MGLRRIRTAALALALTAAASLALPGAAAAAGVAIHDFAYGPSSISVRAGEAVTWVNEGPADHTATGGGFDTGRLARGQSAAHTFATPGTFAYHCTLHPFMKGTVTVVAAASGATPALPRTGLDAPARAALGALLLAAGLALRRTIRA